MDTFVARLILCFFSALPMREGLCVFRHCLYHSVSQPSVSPQTGEFYWDRDLRGTINSSFFWGYVLTQVIGGILARRYGAKWVLGIGALFLIGPTMFSPPASRLSPYALMAMRFIEGLGSVSFAIFF